MTEPTLQGRIALVTGASRGIGRSAAKALAAAGAHVIATARTQGGLEELDDEILAATGHRATLVPLDLLNGDGLDALGLEVHRRWGRLDVLLHAGGMLGGLTPTSHQEPKTWDKVIGANLTSAYRLARAFEPLLLKSDAGRAILLTSRVAVHPRAFWSAYAASKAGLETLGRCWADEIASTPLRVTLLDPGRMRTKMRAEAYPGEDPMASPHPDEIGPLVVELARPDREPPIRVEFRVWKAEQG